MASYYRFWCVYYYENSLTLHKRVTSNCKAATYQVENEILLTSRCRPAIRSVKCGSDCSGKIRPRVLIGRRVLLLARRGQIYLQGQYGKSLQKRKRHVPSQSHDTQRENSKSCRNGFPLNKRTLDFFFSMTPSRGSLAGEHDPHSITSAVLQGSVRRRNFCYKKKTLVLLFVLNCPKAHI